MFNTTVELSDNEKLIHDLINPYLTGLGVVDLGNHFKAYNSNLFNSSDFVDFLKAECIQYKNDKTTKEPKIYCYLDEVYISELDKMSYCPTLIFIDNNYVVNIDCERRISIYDHNMERTLQYKASLDSANINFLTIFPVNFCARKTMEILSFSIGEKNLGQDLKNENKYFFQDENDFKYTFYFENDHFSIHFSGSAYTNIIFDYNMNILDINFSDDVSEELHISKMSNVTSYDNLIEKLKPNFEVFFLENDRKYIFPTEKDIFNQDLLLVKNLITHQKNMKNLFNNILETVNLKDQQKPISDKIELLKFYPDLISENNIVKEINEKIKLNNLESQPSLKNYFGILSTLLLLKEKNENLIDYTIIEKSNLVESRIKKFIKEFEEPSSNPQMKI